MESCSRRADAVVIKATQGRWDPADRCKFFTAGDFGHLHVSDDQWRLTNRYQPTNNNLFAVNDFAEVGKPLDRSRSSWQQFLLSIEIGCDTFLDSGIFYLTNVHKRQHDVSMDEALSLPPEEIDNFSWLLDIYMELCTEYGDRLWGYNELDQGGRENKIRTRQFLESQGLRPIPVYHPMNDGWDYFDDLAQHYDRMCFGNVVQANRPMRERLLMTAYERHAQYPDLYIHFLGLTPNELQLGIPWDSADSSTWTAVFRYPQAVRIGGAGCRKWQVHESCWLPLKATTDQRITVGDMSVGELYMHMQSFGHHHQRLADEFHMRFYPEGKDQSCPTPR